MTTRGSTYNLDDLGGGRFRHTQHLRPVNYLVNGSYSQIINNFIDGDASFPHVIDAAPMLVYTAANGDRRICPTRDPSKYLSVGAPFINPASPTRVSLNPFTRSGNILTSINTNVDVKLAMGGHFFKLEFELKGGYVPPQSKIAFPVSLVGLTRSGADIFDGPTKVMSVQLPVVYDAANPVHDIRPIATSFVSVSGQVYLIFTLPSLGGMSRPVIDPTLSLQPDATDGLDLPLRSNQATTNYGTVTWLAIGESRNEAGIYRTLIKFDLSSIPSNSNVSSATLSLYANYDGSDNARTFRVYRQKRAWVEAEATWNIYSTGNNWQTAGGFGANDCEQTDIGARDFTASETINVFKDFPLTPTTISGLDLGNGWMLMADTELNDEYEFDSSDSTTAANRPKLVVVYTTPVGGMLYPSVMDGMGTYFRGMSA